jgi:hypothetical protein
LQAPSALCAHQYRFLVSPPTFIRFFVPLLVMCTFTLCGLPECPHCAPPLRTPLSLFFLLRSHMLQAACRRSGLRHTEARRGAARGTLIVPTRRLLRDSWRTPPWRCLHLLQFAMSVVYYVSLCVPAEGATPLEMQALCMAFDFCHYPPLLRSSLAHNSGDAADQSAGFCRGRCPPPMWCVLWWHDVLHNGCRVRGMW